MGCGATAMEQLGEDSCTESLSSLLANEACQLASRRGTLRPFVGGGSLIINSMNQQGLVRNSLPGGLGVPGFVEAGESAISECVGFCYGSVVQNWCVWRHQGYDVFDMSLARELGTHHVRILRQVEPPCAKR